MIKRISIIFLLPLMLQGCSIFVSFEDISNQPKYSDLIGQTYQTLEELEVHGISLRDPPERNIDEYVVTTKPGFSGNYVKDYSSLPSGSTIKVIGVHSCIDCYLDFYPRIKFEIEIVGHEKYRLKPVFLNNSFANNKISVELEGKVKLNSNLFKSKPNQPLDQDK